MKIGLSDIGILIVAGLFIWCCLKISGDDK